MSEKNKIRALWPTLFGEFHNENHQNIKKELINFFEEYKKKNPSGRKKSSLGTENYNLYESKYDLHMQKNPVYDKLFSDFIMRGFFTMSNEANKNLLNNFSDLIKRTSSSIEIKKIIDNYKLTNSESPRIGSFAPKFSGPGLNGEVISLYSIKSKYILIDFWASWCPPCIQEAETLAEGYKDWKDKNVKFFISSK